jgi:uncharacterized protein (TIGR03435 family)
MAKNNARRLKANGKFLTIAIWLVVGAAEMLGQESPHPGTGRATAAREVQKSSAFEVVSIRPHQRKPWESSQTVFTPDGFRSTNSPLYVVLIVAYDLRNPTLLGIKPGEHLSRIPGAPEWTYSDFYDIEAKMSDSDIETLQGLNLEERNSRMRAMLQALLADRFSLKVHTEVRSAPAYDLVVTSRGPKNMKQEADSETPHLDWTGRTHIRAHAFAIAGLAKPILTARMGCPVTDKTGMTGKYDFTLDWSEDAVPITGPEGVVAPDPSGPSIFTALQEQLGLKLVPTKAPIESIVIDHIERPSEN